MKHLGIGLLACVFLVTPAGFTLHGSTLHAPPPGANKAQPYGLYYLLPTPNNSAEAIADVNRNLTNTNCDGFRLRVAWKDIQPTGANTYDWSIIDTIRNLVGGSGKKLGISVSAGIVCPDWVYTSSPTVYKFTLDPSTGTVNDDVAGPPPYSLPFPWDTNFQDKWRTFLNAFGARYDRDSAISYVVTTGYMQLATLNFIQNSDASQTFQDGVTTSGSFNFGTSTQAASFTSADIGKVISGNAAFLPNTTIVSRTDARHVVLSKAMLSSGTAQTFVIEQRLVGQGDDSIVNGLAISHPTGAAGAWHNYSDTAPSPPYPPNHFGYASNAAFIEGSEAVIDMFFTAFPSTSLLISPQSPFPMTNPYTSDTNTTVKQYVTVHTPTNHGGTDYTNLQAIVTYPTRVTTPNPNVKQCIHASLQTDQLYAPPVPNPIPPAPQPLMDLMESAYSKGAYAMEMYAGDMEADNSDGRLGVLTSERLKFLP